MAKLVAIGDSLTQGFQNLAITHVDLSFPAMIARCMELDVQAFRTPDFTGSGGLPCNLEWIARGVEQRHGHGIGVFGWPAAALDIVELLDDIEDYWQTGPGSKPGAAELYHNLAVWGFEVGDAYSIRAQDAFDIASKNVKDAWFHPPSQPRMRTAWRVLNPSLDPLRNAYTQIEAAKAIAAGEGGIENLIVWLGANNCLGTVVDLDATLETTDEPPGPFSDRTLWRPAAFAKEYERLARGIADIGAVNVFVGTVPHVTIPPITLGIMKDGGELPEDETYFDYYARFFDRARGFDPERDPHLTKTDARHIDEYIDAYNECILATARQRNWHVVDTCRVLDELAVRRNHGNPTYVLPEALRDLNIMYPRFAADGGLIKGGLISLDGVHPTTCGYSVVAREFIRVMNAATGQAIREPDYAAIRAIDSLVSHAPTTLHDIEGMLWFLEQRFHISRWIKGVSSLR
jgi:hypothetical protein